MQIMKNKKHLFTSALLNWYSKNGRELPWIHTNDPYLIWISEIVLQQTRVNQGMAYYERFIKAFPNVHLLAEAHEDEVLKMWEGLGYYSRARNLHQSAKTIVTHHQGKLPETYKELLSLPGIGPYTASAIMSFAFGQPYTAIDGNAIRVFSRYLGMEYNVYETEGKSVIHAFANEVICKENPGNFNQAIFDLGAEICIPRNPRCDECPIKSSCLAHKSGKTDQIPNKKKRKEKIKKDLNYCILICGNKTLIKRRNGNGIWKGLYEFPELKDARKYMDNSKYNFDLICEMPPVKHLLTHRELTIRFSVFQSDGLMSMPECEKVSIDLLMNYPFPVPIKNHIIDKNVLKQNF